MGQTSAKGCGGGGGGGEVPPLVSEGNFSYAVFDALEGCDEDMLQRITDSYTVDAQNRDGTTLLMVAAYYGSVASVRFLIERGAAVNIQNSARYTALHYACVFVRNMNKNDEVFGEVLLLLLRAGADPTLKNRYGLTPREYAK